MSNRPPQRASAPALHVHADRSGAWRVHAEGAEQPVSRHSSETDAERAAARRAAETGAGDVVVHDRYHRVHTVPCGLGRHAAGG